MLLASQEYSHFRSYAEYKSGENSQRLHNEEAVSGGEQVGWGGGGMRQVKGEGGEGRECRAYRASPKNTEGDGFLYYVSLPHPPAPVFHKQ